MVLLLATRGMESYGTLQWRNQPRRRSAGRELCKPTSQASLVTPGVSLARPRAGFHPFRPAASTQARMHGSIIDLGGYSLIRT